MADSSPMPRLLLVLALLIAAACATGATGATQAEDPRVLVFSKTAGFRHTSIEPGIAAIRRLGQENGFTVEATEDASAFSETNLGRFRAVIFLSTTGDVLDPAQESAF